MFQKETQFYMHIPPFYLRFNQSGFFIISSEHIKRCCNYIRNIKSNSGTHVSHNVKLYICIKHGELSSSDSKRQIKTQTGIAGIQFMPGAILKYLVQRSTTSTTLTIKVTLTFPTAFTSIKMNYMVQMASSAAGPFHWYSDKMAGVSTNWPENLPASWSLTPGFKQKISYYSISNSVSAIYNSNLKKCVSNIYGFIGSSTGDYQYQAESRWTGATTSLCAQYYRLYNNTLGQFMYSQIIIFDHVITQIYRNSQFQLENIEFTAGIINGSYPVYDPLIYSGFIVPNYITIRVNTLFTYDFNFSTGFSLNPSVGKNTFTLALFTTRSCSNPLANVNVTSFQCTNYMIYTCSPQSFQLITGVTNNIYQVQISQSNRFLAMCFDDKVVVYKFNGSSYNTFQTLLMSTDCRGIDFNQDFSIMVITGTNLFQVYATDSSGQYINFYSFPSQLGLTYTNKRISMSYNGMKVVILSTAGAIIGHYYFVYDRTANQYVYKRFQASGANEVFFNKDGSILYVLTSKRLVVYEEKDPAIMGNFVIKYVLDTLKPQNYSSNGNCFMNIQQTVLVISIPENGFKVYLFDEPTQRFAYHHSIISKEYFGGTRVNFIKLSSNGLQMIISHQNSGMFFYYRRGSILDNFQLFSTSNSDFVLYTGSSNALGMSLDGKVITQYVRSTPTYTIRIFSCGPSIVNNVDPPNGIDLIYNSAQQFKKKVQNLSNSSSIQSLDQRNSKEIASIKQTLKVIIGFLVGSTAIILGVITILVVVIKKGSAASTASSQIKPQIQQKEQNNFQSQMTLNEDITNSNVNKNTIQQSFQYQQEGVNPNNSLTQIMHNNNSLNNNQKKRRTKKFKDNFQVQQIISF